MISKQSSIFSKKLEVKVFIKSFLLGWEGGGSIESGRRKNGTPVADVVRVCCEISESERKRE